MKLFRVSFPDILVTEDNENSLEVRLNDDFRSSEFYNDITHYSTVEVTNKQQLDDFDDYYIPYGKTPDDWGVKKLFKFLQTIESLDDDKKQLIFEYLNH